MTHTGNQRFSAWSGKTPRLARRAMVALACIAVAAVAACSGGSGSASGGEKNGVINLTVWTDVNRQAGFEAYEKQHPNVHFTFDLVSSGSADAAVNGVTFPQKVLLSNRTGSGWPDIAFLTEPSNFAEVEAPNVNYPVNLANYIPKSIVNGFPQGTLSVCENGGQLDCLRNDIAQDVLWYNAPLMKKWGYSVPTTWAQYEALGEKVARQHPGYIIGDINGDFGLSTYFWSGECPFQQSTGTLQAKVNMMASTCQNMASLLDVLVKDHTVSTIDPESAGFVQTFDTKALMFPGPDWIGTDTMETTYKVPRQTWAAALMPAWTLNSPHWTGVNGVGAYMVSNHSQNIAAAVKVVEWMATNTSPSAFQDTSHTYPAYGPAAAAWAARGGNGTIGYFQTDPYNVFDDEASKVWPGDSIDIGYDYDTTFTDTMTEAAASGKSLVSELPVWQSQASQLLTAAGYTVTH